LPQHLKDVLAKLRQFVEKEDAAMGHADLARTGETATSDESSVRDCVVRCAKWPLADERLTRR
jgi:hypothetical protein